MTWHSNADHSIWIPCSVYIYERVSGCAGETNSSICQVDGRHACGSAAHMREPARETWRAKAIVCRTPRWTVRWLTGWLSLYLTISTRTPGHRRCSAGHTAQRHATPLPHWAHPVRCCARYPFLVAAPCIMRARGSEQKRRMTAPRPQALSMQETAALPPHAEDKHALRMGCMDAWRVWSAAHLFRCLDRSGVTASWARGGRRGLMQPPKDEMAGHGGAWRGMAGGGV